MALPKTRLNDNLWVKAVLALAQENGPTLIQFVHNSTGIVVIVKAEVWPVWVSVSMETSLSSTF